MPRNRQAYLKQVAAFITANGPEFDLEAVEKGATRACDCCGYYPIKNHYHVLAANSKTFIIGSECQTWVLDFTTAHLPASRVRKLEAVQLVQLGVKYGLSLDEKLGQLELAKLVINARRKYANTAGWVSRRDQGKAPPAKADPTPLRLNETN